MFLLVKYSNFKVFKIMDLGLILSLIHSDSLGEALILCFLSTMTLR